MAEGDWEGVGIIWQPGERGETDVIEVVKALFSQKGFCSVASDTDKSYDISLPMSNGRHPLCHAGMYVCQRVDEEKAA